MNVSVTLRKRRATVFCIIAVLLMCFVGSVMASGGGHEETAAGNEEAAAGHEAAAADHEAAAGGSHGSHWAATDTYKVMNFAVLAIGLFLLLRKPVSQALNARIQGIKEQLVELESKKKAAEEELARYNEKLATLEGEAGEIVAEYIRQGEEARARILTEAESTAEKLEDQAKKNIEHEFNQAKARLQEEIIDKALLKAEEIIKSKISDDDQISLVDEYLAKVVA
jgi:F-type H+-transporting ATPase subunit b